MKTSTIILLLFLMVTNITFGQEDKNQLTGIDTEINMLIKAYKAVGVSVSIVKDHNVIYSKGFGYRNLDEKLPVNAETSFPIASSTKAFTASLLGILQSENKLSLKDKPSLHIPHLQFHNDKMNTLIEIDDLLSHKSGLGNLNATLVLFPETERSKTIEKLQYLKPEGTINDSWIYSNMGYTVAGNIVEEVAALSWDEYLKQHIFSPLDMTNSYTDYDEMIKTNNYSLGYGLTNGETQAVIFEDYYSYSPAGAIKSSSNDLSKWMLTWINNGKFNEKQILPETYVRDAMSIKNIRPQGDQEATSFLYGDGLGWRMESKNGHYKVYHGGNTSGFSSLVIVYPFQKVGITVLTNQQSSTLPYIIADMITNRMLDLPKVEIENYPVIVNDIYLPSNKIKGLNTEKKPTHELLAFCGKYENEGYGTYEVLEENGSLFALFPTYKFALEHIQYNRFKLKALKKHSQVINPDFIEITFLINNDGEITKNEINLQSEPVKFSKVTEH